MFRKEPERVSPWLLAAVAAVGVSAAAYGVLRLIRSRRDGGRPRGPLDSLEVSAVDALRRDPVTGSCGIDVAAIAPGILEISGSVPTQEAGQRAARLLHAIPGVKTVINRVDVESQQRSPAAGQWRGRGGSSPGHYAGAGVGMGRRRQGAETDPAQRDDSQYLKDRSIVAEIDEDDAAQVDQDAERGQPS